MVNALTIDVEDYFHVAAFAGHIDPETWDSYPLRVENNTNRILDLLGERGFDLFVMSYLSPFVVSLSNHQTPEHLDFGMAS
jgi:hypothetical protein